VPAEERLPGPEITVWSIYSAKRGFKSVAEQGAQGVEVPSRSGVHEAELHICTVEGRTIAQVSPEGIFDL
jgi:hypothetical protein